MIADLRVRVIARYKNFMNSSNCFANIKDRNTRCRLDDMRVETAVAIVASDIELFNKLTGLNK